MARTRWLGFAGLIVGAGLRRRRRRGRIKTGGVAIVTGGSRGLGLLLAEGLGRRGMNLVLVARDAEELVVARRRLEHHGARVELVAADLEHPESAKRVVSAAIRRFGRVDAVLNVAGIITVGPEETLSVKEFRRAMEANFWSALRVTREAMPLLEKSRGTVLNVTSIGGAIPVPHLLGYTASKFAMVGWSMGLAAEVAARGVRVVTVLPWLMRTGSFLHAEVKGRRTKEARNFALSSSLPVLTMSAHRAASRMLRALDRGERFVVVGTFAKAARLGFALAPGAAIAVLSTVNRMLPRANGAALRDAHAQPLWRYRRGLGRSPLTRLGDRAAARNNQVLRVPRHGTAAPVP